MRKLLFAFILVTCNLQAYTQTDSLENKNWSIHFQATIIPQGHLNFSAKYTGDNSMLANEPVKVSLTTTLFIGRKLWKNAAVYFNPEVSGGSGLSKTLGAAGFPNGETFRIGSTTPKLYLARLYFEQKFALSDETFQTKNDLNQIQSASPKKYISVRAGKFSLSDFFDNNSYSHDPRTQFLNWSLMSSGAWDYPANTRGYTVGGVAEYHAPLFAIRGALTQVPKQANGPDLDRQISKAFGTVAEVEKSFELSNNERIVTRLAGFYNQANMGNYDEAVRKAQSLSTEPDVTGTRKYSRSKSGFYLNTEYDRLHGGYFLRFSYNDGQNETWVFTEIDRSVSLGASFDGSAWKRNKDQWGIAFVNNGISHSHLNYLKAGGYGFIIGDGNLNYGTESILEGWYSVSVEKLHLFLSPDYQFIVHPAYNKDRGPVHVFSLRLHIVI